MEAFTSNDARREIDRKVDVKFGRLYSVKSLSKKVSAELCRHVKRP